MKTSAPFASITDVSPDALRSFSSERGEPAWALELRLKALAEYAALPWPGPRDEKWKRLELETIPFKDLAFAAAANAAGKSTDALPAPLKAFTATNGVRPARLFWDLGAAHVIDVPSDLASQGVEWITLETALTTKADKIRAAWSRAVENAKGNKFLLLNLALANGGFCLTVPKNQQLKAPVHSYLYGGAAGAYFNLNFVFVEQGAEVQIWEDLIGSQGKASDKPVFVSSYAAIEVDDNAKAGFYYLQQWDERTVHLQFQDVTQKAQSRFNAVAVAVGGRIFRNEAAIHLSGPNAENKVLGVIFGDGSQNFENWITQNHAAPKTTSDIQYRGALKGASRSFFSGMVSIEKQAQQSDAFQSAKSLLLSRDAKADAIPNLEILADDVKCSHGAAVGPVDEDQKFYLQTRGVPPALAEDIIVQGFFDPVIAEVPSEPVQERLRAFVEAKLHQ